MAFEYFDIPYRYNETCIKLLFQNPFVLFVFWDISDSDEQKFIQKYGQEAYNNSGLFLKIVNISNGYEFKINIDPFAKTWYINDIEPNCNYRVELFRQINNSSIFITSSNNLDIPTNRPSESYEYEFRFINSANNTIEYIRNTKENIKCMHTNIYNDIDNIELTIDMFNTKKNILDNPSSFSNVSSGERYFKN